LGIGCADTQKGAGGDTGATKQRSRPATEAAQQVEPDDVSELIDTARDEELKDGDLRAEIESGPEGSAVRASFEEAQRTEDEP
jgi:hypothetical protein